MADCTQQTLGPVLPVVRVGDADEAFELARRGPAGPCVSVWTRDTVTATRAVACLAPARVSVNDISIHVARPQPF